MILRTLYWLRGFMYSITSVLFVKKFPLTTLKTARESAETLCIKAGGIWEFGSGGGDYKDCTVDSKASTPAVPYTQYNWFVGILPLSLLYTPLLIGGAVKHNKNDQKLNIWREKKQNENTSAASIPE